MNLDPDTRARLARQVNPIAASHGLEAAVDHLWAAFTQTLGQQYVPQSLLDAQTLVRVDAERRADELAAQVGQMRDRAEGLAGAVQRARQDSRHEQAAHRETMAALERARETLEAMTVRALRAERRWEELAQHAQEQAAEIHGLRQEGQQMAQRLRRVADALDREPGTVTPNARTLED